MGLSLALLGGGADGGAQALASFSQLALSRLVAGGAFGGVIGGGSACGPTPTLFFHICFLYGQKVWGLVRLATCPPMPPAAPLQVAAMVLRCR